MTGENKKELLELRLIGKCTNNSNQENRPQVMEDFYNKSSSNSIEKRHENPQATTVQSDKGSPFTPKSKSHNIQAKKRRTPVSFNISSYLSPSTTKYVKSSDSNSTGEANEKDKIEHKTSKLEKTLQTKTISGSNSDVTPKKLDHLFVVDEYKKKILSLEEENENQYNMIQKMKDILIVTFRQNVLAYINKRNKRILKNNVKLGHIVTVRQGVHFVEQWEKGSKFLKYEKALENNQKSREELEKKKKNLLRAFRNSSTNSSVNNEPVTIKSLKEANVELNSDEIELVKLQLLSLKKEENELNNKLDNLNKCRNIHLRELRNMSVENHSRFSGGQLLNDNSYMLMHAIGKGGFSEVFKAFDLVNLEEVACKIHQISSEWREERKNNYVKHAMREFQIHKNLKHPNIAHLLDVFLIDNNTFVSIMEYCETDLDFILKQYKILPEREAKLIIIQVVNALKYLNELKTPVIHYDLKPANILFTDTNNWHVKITDFGLSKVMPRNFTEGEMSGMELTSQGAGTYWYLPPECFVVGRNPPKISSKVDVWSIGVIFYQMLYGMKPFGHNMTQPDIIESKTILNAKVVEFKPKPAVSNDGKNFIRRCLTYCKDSRPDVIQLSDDSYLTSGRRSYILNDKLHSPTVNNSSASHQTLNPLPRLALTSIINHNENHSRSES